MKRLAFASIISIAAWTSIAAAADPPVPSSAHPRLFMSSQALAGYKANAAKNGTAAASLVAQCDDTLNDPNQYSMRGGSDGNYWPQSAVACAFAYTVTQKAQYLTQAIKYWQASLNDDQTIGDGKGCVQGVSTNWQTWAQSQSGPTPPIILTVTHDTGYAYRWYGADIALTYDWLNSASGLPANILAQTRTCLGAWADYYTGYGYHNDEAGANYNAGYIIGKTLTAIAIGNDGGADGHLWTQVLDTDFATLNMALAGTGTVGTPAGVMLGGDWGEGWQYGPLSVLEYSTAARALENYGASLPLFDQWSGDLALRAIYAMTAAGQAMFCGNGDCDITTPNLMPDVNELDAVLVGSSSAQAASWAESMKEKLALGAGDFTYNAFAELRGATPVDYASQSPAPPLWYLARGTRSVFARTSWSDTNAFWGVFSAEPALNSDHEHFAASNFVFSRGADDLVVDPSPYGGPATRQTNALSAEASVDTGDYAGTQTPWSIADLTWARATADNTFATRADIAHAFDFNGTSSDITYAHREWAMLPEGEIALIDRVHTSAATRHMIVTLHTNTGGGGLTASNGVYSGTIGGSKVAIHPVLLSGGTPSVSTPAIFNGSCSTSCNYPCGQCTDTRFKVDAYTVAVPGTWAVAVHVIDGLAASDAAPTVLSMNDATVDPSKQNTGVLGASILRNNAQSYVVASSATDGASPSMMTYGVPASTQSRHVVYDAPEASDGTSSVTASAQTGRCVLTITAGSGGGFTGHPLVFNVASATSGCTPSDLTNVAPPGVDGGTPPDGGPTSSGDGGSSATGDGGSTNNGDGGTNPTQAHSKGCGCSFVGRADGATSALLLVALAALLRRRNRKVA